MSNLTSNKNHWCPYCSHQKLCSNDNCMQCYKKSFASYTEITTNGKKKVDCFDIDKNNIHPRQIFIKSEKTYIFNCDNCPHTFYGTITAIVSSKSWCIYCTTNIRNSRLCDDINCKNCFNKSLASFSGITLKNRLKIDCWIHAKNKKTLRDIALYTNHKYWFLCDICNNQFNIIIGNMTGVNNSWCPYCKNKTELYLLNYLQNKSYLSIHQAKYDWCVSPTSNRYLPFDICINELNLVIEIDGAQHFKQVANWESPEYIFQKDKYKMRKCFENNYSMIRIYQPDLLYGKISYDEIHKHIKNYNNPTLICMSNDNIYGKYITIWGKIKTNTFEYNECSFPYIKIIKTIMVPKNKIKYI